MKLTKIIKQMQSNKRNLDLYLGHLWRKS